MKIHSIRNSIAVIAMLFCTLFLSSCSVPDDTTNTVKNDADYYKKLTYAYGDQIMDYVDPETGVHYLLYDGYEGCGITVRYNADGTIMVDQHPEDR